MLCLREGALGCTHSITYLLLSNPTYALFSVVQTQDAWKLFSVYIAWQPERFLEDYAGYCGNYQQSQFYP